MIAVVDESIVKRLLVDWRWWVGVAVLAVGVGLFAHFGRPVWGPVVVKVTGGRTVDDVIARYGPAAEPRLLLHFERAGVGYPPRRLVLVGLKAEKELEVWAEEGEGLRLVHVYPIVGASGGPGPKLRQGDRQVPEGVYGIAGLNPNSSYHLSMKINYPDDEDQALARAEGRSDPGGDIFIHGKSGSVGCLAMGDEAIEELFILVARVGIEHVTVALAPNDLRKAPPATDMSVAPAWLAERYARVRAAMPSGGGR